MSIAYRGLRGRRMYVLSSVRFDARAFGIFVCVMKDLDDHLSSSGCELRLGGSMVACRLLECAA